MGAGIKLAQPISSKAAKWVKGRKHLFAQLDTTISSENNWIWIHVASLGEFEQGRPLIEMIRKQQPENRILLTFFSPSGYEIRKAYKGADFVTYMPLDTPDNARKFLDIVKPRLVIFVKYEIWYNHFREMMDRNIPLLLVSAQFRAGQFYFKRPGRMFLPVLKNLEQIFVADEQSQVLLKEHGFQNVERSGDTRVDRVLQIANRHQDFGIIRDVLQSEQILVAGSTWPEDIRHLLPMINEGKLKCVIAPHENDEQKLLALEKMLTIKSIRLSQIHEDSSLRVDAVIVDTMGQLADIYHVGSIAFVGGGFSSGIHNILEPVAHRLPVIVGPNHKNFREASELIELGVCVPAKSALEIKKAIDEFGEMDRSERVAELASQYLQKHAGATARIYDYIHRERLLKNGVD